MFRRTFYATTALFALKNHRLFPKINWERVESGQYAVVDPMNPGSILYLSEQDYIILVRTSMVANKTPKVLATPDDTAPTDPQDGPPSQNSPTFVESMTHPYLEGITFTGKEGSESGRRAKGRIQTFFKSRLDSFRKKEIKVDTLGIKRWEKVTMVNLNSRNVAKWFNQWHSLVSWWSRGSLMSTVAEAERNSFGLGLKSSLQKRGIQDVIRRLKVSLCVVNSFLGGQRLTTTQPLGLRMRLSKGLPSWLPLYVRTGIRGKNIHTIHTWTSMLFSYKGISGTHLEPNLAESSITARHPDYAGNSMFTEFQQIFAAMFWEAVGFNKPIGITYFKIKNMFFTTHAGPQHPNSVLGSGLDANLWFSQPVNLVKEWLLCTEQNDVWQAFRRIAKMSKLTGEILASLSSPPKGVTYLKSLLGINREFDKTNVKTLGRLHCLYEAAGKVRIIAIVDYWTNACLKPLHDWMFRTLKKLPQDATFDQEGKVLEFSKRGYTHIWSLDLKSATDLIPLQLYRALFSWILPQRLLDLWIDFLVSRDFNVPKSTKKAYPQHPDRVRYTTGQPMGALTSWASMALLHHALVLYAACRVGRFNPVMGLSSFTAYLVLGDDVVIACEATALEYIRIAESLGIPISLHKSYISQNGMFNFANQTYLETNNFSPLSMKEEVGINSIAERIEFVLRALRRGWVDTSSHGWLTPFTKFFVSPKVWKNDICVLLSTYGLVHPVVRWILSVLFLPGSTKLGFANLGLGRASIECYLAAMLRKGSLYSKPLSSISDMVKKTRSEPLLLSLLHKWVDRVYKDFLECRKNLRAFQPWLETTVSPELEYVLTRIFSEAKEERIKEWQETYRIPLKEVQVCSSMTKFSISDLEIGTERRFDTLVDLIAEAEAALPRVPEFTSGDLGVLTTLLEKPGHSSQERSMQTFLRISNVMGMVDHLVSPATPGISLAKP